MLQWLDAEDRDRGGGGQEQKCEDKAASSSPDRTPPTLEHVSRGRWLDEAEERHLRGRALLDRGGRLVRLSVSLD